MANTLSNFMTALIFATLAASQSATAQCAKYSVEIFAGPQGCLFLPSAAFARGISATGAICGGYDECGGSSHPVIWGPTGEIIELPLSAEGGSPTPLDLNASGEVVGQLHVPDLSPFYRAFLYADGVTINLGTLPGHNNSVAGAINADSVVVGSSSSAIGPLAFVWQDGKMSTLNLPYGSNSEAYDISDTGKICGWMGNHAQNDTHAFIYELPSGRVVDVGAPLPETNNARATGVNNAGVLCGWSYIPCGKFCLGRKSFIWSNGVAQDLGVLPEFLNSQAQALNDSNVVVGYCNMVPINNVHRAFVWQNGVMHDLNDLISPALNLNIQLALDINNAGQIVAHATRPSPNGWEQIAVRLTPIPPLVGDITCDWKVNVSDLLEVLNAWGPCPPPPPGEPFTKYCHADLNGDNTVSLDDLLAVVTNWAT